MIGADGLTLDRQGRLILAAYAGGSLMRVETNGKRTILADRWEGKRFGGPNDVVVKSDGAIYFTDTGQSAGMLLVPSSWFLHIKSYRKRASPL